MSNLSIDIGGTKTRVGFYDLSYTLIEERMLNTQKYFPKRGEVDLRKLFSHIQAITNRSYFDTLGISFNCAIQDNVIIYSSLLGGGEGIDLHSLAKEYFTFENFFSDNDVINMAKAEIQLGIGKHHKNFLYVNLGTGIKVVAVEDKKIIRGIRNLAGEIAVLDMWVEEANAHVKADDLLAGRGIKKITTIITGKEMEAPDVFKQEHTKIINIYARCLADFLRQASYFYNPELIIFSGSLTKSALSWLPRTEKLYKEHTPYMFQARKLLVSELQYPASLGALLS